MKYIVITRSLQTDFQWEYDARGVAKILLDLLIIDVPETLKERYNHYFVEYFARYISDSSIKNGESQTKIRSVLFNLLEQIESSALHNIQNAESFLVDYSNSEIDLLHNLIETTIEQYYLLNKPELVEMVEFLKQDYGHDLIFLNSSKFYNNLTRKFYDHECDVFYCQSNERDDMIAEFVAQHKYEGEDFTIVLA
ncbi:MAG: hypothetical protein GY793_04130 [Proteobacteria bacterium]|nr:hypothetical protein [Pseudomonadota bacterium]